LSKPIQVKVSSRNQIAVPSRVREQLNIRSGDRLLVDIQDGVIVLVPQPVDYTTHLSGLYRQVWQDLDTSAYLREEREAWDDSPKS
jgi:AbrB family looped-hinge helix DNA binding protein